VARWDPPDSVAFALPVPPPVGAVIQDEELYYLLHPKGEEEYLYGSRPRGRGKTAAKTPPPDTTLAAVDTTAAGAPDSLTALVDTLATPGDSAAAAETTFVPPPPVQVDLSRREEDILTRRARVDMERAERILDVLEQETRNDPEVRIQLRSVRSYLEQTRAALRRRDFQGAANLALKARILAESLYEREE
jgi:hypothetical protein